MSVEQVREADRLGTLRVADEPRVTAGADAGGARRAAGAARPMSAAYVYDAVRTPFGRYGGGLAGRAARRPRRRTSSRARRTRARARSRADRRRAVRQRQRRGRGQPRRRAHGRAARRAARRASPARSINRLCGSSLDAAMQASRAVETGDASLDARRRRRVDVARAVGRAQAREGAARAATQTLHSTTLGWRMVNPRDAGPVDDLARREHGEARRDPRHHARGAGRVRAAQPPRRPRRRGTPASTTTGSSRCPETDLARDENVRRDTHAGEARQAQARVRARTGRSPPATRRRSTTAPARC